MTHRELKPITLIKTSGGAQRRHAYILQRHFSEQSCRGWQAPRRLGSHVSGGVCLDQTQAGGKSCTQSVRQMLFWCGWPFWTWTLWGVFWSLFHVCSIAWQHTHRQAVICQRWWGIIWRRRCTATGKRGEVEHRLISAPLQWEMGEKRNPGRELWVRMQPSSWPGELKYRQQQHKKTSFE